MFENLKNTVEELGKNAIDELKYRTKDFKQAVDDKIQIYMVELNALLPAIREIGYEMDAVEIEITMPPKIIPSFSKIKDVSQETMQNTLSKYSGKKISTLILSSLIKADTMQNAINSDNLIFIGLSLEIGIVPTVKLKFIPKANKQLENKK